jgi:hypothetical protein
LRGAGELGRLIWNRHPKGSTPAHEPVCQDPVARRPPPFRAAGAGVEGRSPSVSPQRERPPRPLPARDARPVAHQTSYRLIAFLTDELSIRRILDHLGLSTPAQDKPPPVREILRVAEQGESWGVPASWE